MPYKAHAGRPGARSVVRLIIDALKTPTLIPKNPKYWRARALNSSSAPKRRMAVSSSSPNTCFADAAEARGSSTVRPLFDNPGSALKPKPTKTLE